jgi:hypothetical protein
MKPIAIFYHCLFFIGNPPKLLPAATGIVEEQMNALRSSGLLDAASHFLVGVNGGNESLPLIEKIIPAKATRIMHGLKCRNECRTIQAMQQWLPGREDFYVLYFHSKGATHAAGDGISTPWRACMMKNAIKNWKTCISDLDSGYEAVGSHWMAPPQTPVGQRMFAGTFFWAKASFLATLPAIESTARVKLSGIDSLDSRYEAEVWMGNGPRIPIIKDYHGPNWNPGKIGTCNLTK